MIKPNLKQLNPRVDAWMAKVCVFAALAGLVSFWVGCVKDSDSDSVSDSSNQKSAQQKRLDGVIVGSSMAPHFMGQHQQVQCGKCGFEIAFDPDSVAAEGLFCPNCGENTKNDSRSAVRSILADSVLIDPAAAIERWSVVAFKRGDQSSAGVKRVVGLPGETIWFDRGNVVCQKSGKDRVLKKSLADQLMTRVLVHDNRFRTDSPRWAAVDNAPLAVLANSNDVSQRLKSGSFEWRKFVAKRCYAHSARSGWSPSLEDNYGFNQGLARQLNPVNEVMLECELPPNPKAEMLMVIAADPQVVIVRFARTEKGMVAERIFAGSQHGGAPFVSERVAVAAGQRVVCQVSNMDHQLLVSVNDQVLESIRIADFPSGGGSAELFVATPATAAESDLRIRLWRDLYYFSGGLKESLIARQHSQATSESGYFLVGDNVPVSGDSRQWKRPSVPQSQILGRVFKK